MNISEICIRRPVLTTLMTASLIVFGAFAYRLLPVAALPAVDFPTIQISAQLPGASPETMAASVAAPIERQLSTIAGISSMNSSSSIGQTQITIQFDLNRNIDGAALDVQTALATAARRLPVEMTTPPFFRKVNPGDFPVLYVSLRSDTMPLSAVDDYAETVLAQQISQLPGVAQVLVYGAQKFAVRVQVDPVEAAARNISLDDVRSIVAKANSIDAGRHADRQRSQRDLAGDRRDSACERLPRRGRCLPQRRAGQAQPDRARHRQRRKRQDRDLVQRFPRHRAGDPAPARRQHGRRWSTWCATNCRPCAPRCRRRSRCSRCSTARSRSATRSPTCRRRLAIAIYAGHHGDLPVPAEGFGDDHSGAGGAGVAGRHLRGDVRSSASPSTT